MTHTDNFDADETETLDGEFEQTDMEAAPEEGEADVAPPKKSGGAGKFIAVLAVLLIGGGVGAAKLGLLPFEIPGLSPAQPAPAHTASGTPPAPAPAPPAPAATANAAPSPATPPAPAETNMAAMPPPLGAPAPANGAALSPVSGPDAAVPPFGAPGGDKPAAAPGGDKKNDNAAFMPEGIPHAGGPVTIAPPSGSMMPPPLSDATAASLQNSPMTGNAKPDVKAPLDHKPEAMHGVPPMPAVTPAPVTADALEPPGAPMTPAATPGMTMPSAATAAESEKVQKLEARIESLEKTIADLKSGMASKSDVNDLRASLQHMSAAPVVAAAMEASPTATAMTAAPKAPKPASHAASRHHTAMMESRPPASRMVATTHRWVLKAATPNTAWVAAPGSSEIKSVSVGETLPGLGKITAVNKDSSGRWVVLGTRGKINQ